MDLLTARTRALDRCVAQLVSARDLAHSWLDDPQLADAAAQILQALEDSPVELPPRTVRP